jgi:hypothetical protein
MTRLTAAVVALLGTLACSAYPYIGQVTTGGSSGAAASGGDGTTAGSVTGSGTAGGSASGGTTTGGTTAIGDPTIAASDAAVDPSQCEVDFDFGNLAIGLATSETFTISNTGNGVLDLLPINATLDPAFVLTGATPAPIQPGGQLQFSVSFTPTVPGEVTSVFTVPTDGLNTSCPAVAGATTSSLTVQLTGDGIPSCLHVQSDILDFGNTEVNTANKQSVTLSNTCTSPATGIVATIAGVDSNLFTVDSAPTTLQAGAQATVDITYSPLALETRSIANVTFTDDDSVPATVNLF